RILMAMTTTKTETKVATTSTLERLRAERADILRQHQRAAALTDPGRTQDRDTEGAELAELVMAPETVARTRHALRVLDVQILEAERAAGAAAEAARAALLAEGQQLLAREWPALVEEQRRLQRKWQALGGRLE